MNKRLFDIHLYREAMRQARAVVLPTAGIVLFTSVFVPMMVIFRDESGVVPGAMRTTISLPELNQALFLIFLVAAPATVIRLFSFLRNRAGTDFYGAAPVSGSAVYISFLSAAITCMTGLLWGGGLISVGIVRLVGSALTIRPALMIACLIQMTAATWFTAAAAAAAVYLTGTLFSHISAVALLIYMPRLFGTLLLSQIRAALPFIGSGTVSPLLDYQYHIPTAIVMSLVGKTDSLRILSDYRNGLYTFGLFLIYFVCGLLLSLRRRGEHAECSGIRPAISGVFRFMAAMMASLFPIITIFHTIMEKGAFTEALLVRLVFAYATVIGVYVLYELLSTRQLRSAVKSMSGLPLVAFCNVIVICGLLLISRNIINDRPRAEQIESIRIEDIGAHTYMVGVYDISLMPAHVSLEDNYFLEKISDIELTQPAVLEMMASRFSETVENYVANPSRWYDDVFTEEKTIMDIDIRLKNEHLRRKVKLSSEDVTLLARAAREYEAFREVYQNLPELGKRVTVQASDGMLSTAQAERLYQRLREEVKAIDFEDWYRCVCNESYSEMSSQLMLRCSRGSQTRIAMLPIGRETPESRQLYMSMVNENQEENRRSMCEMIRLMAREGYRPAWFNWFGREFQYDNGQWKIQALSITCDSGVWMQYKMKDGIGEYVTMEESEALALLESLMRDSAPQTSYTAEHFSLIAADACLEGDMGKQIVCVDSYFGAPLTRDSLGGQP